MQPWLLIFLHDFRKISGHFTGCATSNRLIIRASRHSHYLVPYMVPGTRIYGATYIVPGTCLAPYKKEKIDNLPAFPSSPWVPLGFGLSPLASEIYMDLWSSSVKSDSSVIPKVPVKIDSPHLGALPVRGG